MSPTAALSAVAGLTACCHFGSGSRRKAEGSRRNRSGKHWSPRRPAPRFGSASCAARLPDRSDLGPEAVRRFGGAVGWVVARGTGPVVLDLTELRSWSAEGQLAITKAARRLADAGRSLELAAIPAEGSLVPAGDCPDIPVGHPNRLTECLSVDVRGTGRRGR
ncbi:hypothetical protein [Streptomyces sp. NPDC001816]|uniref:hypothetical protein n=1 Tax=Streptomyces sp. NPDC001816 TaxID=3364612 RepID=UPI0036A8FC32